MATMNVGDQLNDVIQLGRSWGMSNAEIEDCLKSQFLEENPKPKDTLLRTVGSILKALIVIPVILCLLVFGTYFVVSTVSSLSPDAEHVLGQLVNPYVYPALRGVRIAFKPLIQYLNINLAGYYNSDCVVENPFYVDPIGDCNVCIHKVAFAQLAAKDIEKMHDHMQEMTPFVVRSYYKEKVDFLQLQQMYAANEAKMELGGTVEFNTNLPSAVNISDVINGYNTNKILSSKKGASHVTWGTNSVPTSQAIRKLFPRPKFIFEEAEVSLHKRIFIDGPLSGSYELPIGGFANGWYQQAAGTRKLTLVPHPECQDQCEDISVVLEAGDIVYFQDQYWRMLSSPAHKVFTDQLSVGFAGSFTF